MKKLILLGLLSIYSLSSFSFSVDYEDNDDFQMVGRTDTPVNFDLYSSGSGNGKSESSARQVYMPWAISVAATTKHYKVDNLGDNTSTRGGIIFDLVLEDDNRSDLELFVAVKNSSATDYKIVGQLNESTPFVSLSTICSQGTELDCTRLSAGGNANNETDEAYFYVFYADEDENYSAGDTIDPANTKVDNGVFFKLLFSNKLSGYVSEATQITSQSIERGDENLFVKYKGKIADSVVTRVGVFGGKNSDSPDEDTFFEIFNSAGESAVVKVSGLTNDIEYCFLARYIDKFGFMSFNAEALASNCKTPIAIEQLLKEKSCFLVTAGFQRDHYVLDYFRAFRDNILLKYTLGQKFIKFYYSLAPAYAQYIYTNAYLAKTVRGISYVIYFIMKNFIYLVLISLLSPFLFLFARTRNA